MIREVSSPTSQYRNAGCTYLAKKQLDVSRNFTERDHSKGPMDNVIAIIKNDFDNAVSCSSQLLTYPSDSIVTLPEFWNLWISKYLCMKIQIWTTPKVSSEKIWYFQSFSSWMVKCNSIENAISGSGICQSGHPHKHFCEWQCQQQ